MPIKTIVMFGGNGYVGTSSARLLVEQGETVIAVSRSGRMPVHLQDTVWAQQIAWQAGDAGNPDPALLEQADVVVSCVGSPPVPTFSGAAYDRQLYANGTANVALIEAAASSGLQHLVLVNARLPGFLQGEWFAYGYGKRLAREAAIAFADTSDAHSATVLLPGGIYGVRRTASGRALNLAVVMGPIAKLQRAVGFLGNSLVSVDEVAAAVVRGVGESRGYREYSTDAIIKGA